MLQKSRNSKFTIAVTIMVPILLLLLTYARYLVHQQMMVTYNPFNNSCMTVVYELLVGIMISCLAYRCATSDNSRLLNAVYLCWTIVFVTPMLLSLFFKVNLSVISYSVMLKHFFYNGPSRWLAGGYLFVLVHKLLCRCKAS